MLIFYWCNKENLELGITKSMKSSQLLIVQYMAKRQRTNYHVSTLLFVQKLPKRKKLLRIFNNSYAPLKVD